MQMSKNVNNDVSMNPPISYLSVVSSMRFKCVLFSRNHPQKIGEIVISDKFYMEVGDPR